MKLYIFRHGQTFANASLYVQDGHEPLSQLNETGLMQAENLKNRLAQEKLPIIYASPFDRARQTGNIVAEANHSKVEIIDDLREFCFGAAEGLYETDVIQKYKYEFSSVLNVADEKTYDVRLPEGESKREALVRFEKALSYIKTNCPYEKAGVATHGHIMRLFYYNHYHHDYLFDNCEFFELEI